MIAPTDIHATVLAGGEGRRMGGADKGLALFRGQALAQRAAQRIAPCVGKVSISANRHAAQYAALGFEVFGDGWPVGAEYPAAYQGPLGGVLAALKRCTAPYLLVLPCDVPFFPDDLAPRLAQALDAHPAATVAMVSAIQPVQNNTVSTVSTVQKPHVNPVFMLMRAAVLPNLSAFFDAGGRKITTWAGLAGLVVAPFERPADALAFADADSMDELSALERL
jgi:molybdenum cofactor guanylyltransferase